MIVVGAVRSKRSRKVGMSGVVKQLANYLSDSFKLGQTYESAMMIVPCSTSPAYGTMSSSSRFPTTFTSSTPTSVHERLICQLSGLLVIVIGQTKCGRFGRGETFEDDPL